MRPLRITIVDDEPLAIRRLQLALADAPAAEVVGSARNGAAALAMIHDLRPDLVFLDIRMPGLSGLEVATALQSFATPPVVVFTTAFDRFAAAAFRTGAIDYLLKPVDFEQLHATIARSRARLDAEDAQVRLAELQAVVRALEGSPAEPPSVYDDELWVPDRGGSTRLSLSTVRWLGAERDYVRIHTSERSYLVRGSIQAFGEMLNPAHFSRVHRSVIVRRAEVTRLERGPTGGLKLVLVGGDRLPVGRTFRREALRVTTA